MGHMVPADDTNQGSKRKADQSFGGACVTAEASCSQVNVTCCNSDHLKAVACSKSAWMLICMRSRGCVIIKTREGGKKFKFTISKLYNVGGARRSIFDSYCVHCIHVARECLLISSQTCQAASVKRFKRSTLADYCLQKPRTSRSRIADVRSEKALLLGSDLLLLQCRYPSGKKAEL